MAHGSKIGDAKCCKWLLRMTFINEAKQQSKDAAVEGMLYVTLIELSIVQYLNGKGSC